MVDQLMDVGDVRLSHERWQDHNRRGLAFAAAADWVEASDAFAAAAASLSDDPAELTPHEPLALVLGNLAQASFRAGRTDEALNHAQRACALRVALTGEDSMPAARTRMDFAVMLATAGRRDEAMQLVQRAIAAVENHVGEEDQRLTVVLENAARIALSAGAAGSAEPFLLRLHALLALHEESTQSADRLLARIADVRAAQSLPQSLPSSLPQQHPGTRAQDIAPAVPAIPEEPVEEPVEMPAVPTASAVPAFVLQDVPDGEAHLVNVGEWDDQPLRDAVALTDVLLRTTPSGVPAIADWSQTNATDAAPPLYATAEPIPHEEDTVVLQAREAVVTTSPPRGVSVVLPAPNAGSRAFDTSELPGHGDGPSPGSGDKRVQSGALLRPWLPVGGGLAVVAVAAAWWFFLR